MSKRKKRIYNSEFRSVQAAATRKRILACAKKLFQQDGYECTTIAIIAQTAAVSSPTIYCLFKSKLGILRALMDEALPVEHFQALVEEVKREKSPKKRLFISAKIARQIYDAEKAQMDIFRGASVLCPEFKKLEKEKELRRYKRQEESLKILFKEKALIKGLSVKKARDMLWAFTGRDFYRMLVIEQGWTSDEYEKWLGTLLVTTLIDPRF